MADEGVAQTGATGAAPAEGQQAADTQKAAEWSQTFKTPDDMWKSYTSLKSMHDKTVAETKKAQPQQQQATAFDYKDFGKRLDDELAGGGKYSEDTVKALESMGIDAEAWKGYHEHRFTKALEPLKQFIKGDQAEVMKVVNEKIDDNSRQLFRSLLEAGQHEAAAAIANGVFAKAKAGGADAKVGSVSATSGDGYKDFKEVLADRQHPEFNYNKSLQDAHAKKLANTDPALMQQWNNLYASGGTNR